MNQAIRELDLTNVRAKLVESGELSEHEVDEAIKGYKMFLYLCLNHRGVGMPYEEVDKVWHCHILHTRQYQEDCQRIFGHYLHHEPRDISEGEEGIERMQALNERTLALIEEEFGESLLLSASSKCHPCKGQCSKQCWNNCSGGQTGT